MKSYWKSRSLWLHGLVALAPCIPFMHAWVMRDPVHVMQYHGLLAFFLRLDTKDALGKPYKEES